MLNCWNQRTLKVSEEFDCDCLKVVNVATWSWLPAISLSDPRSVFCTAIFGIGNGAANNLGEKSSKCWRLEISTQEQRERGTNKALCHGEVWIFTYPGKWEGNPVNPGHISTSFHKIFLRWQSNIKHTTTLLSTLYLPALWKPMTILSKCSKLSVL